MGVERSRAENVKSVGVGRRDKPPIMNRSLLSSFDRQLGRYSWAL